MDDYHSSDTNAKYTITHWDTTSNQIVSEDVRLNQQLGPGWLRVGGPYNFSDTVEADIIIPNAHYFTTYDENNDGDIDQDEVYLVTIPGSDGTYELKYYQFINTDDNDTNDWNNDGIINMYDRDWKDDLDDGELIPLNPLVPADYERIQNIKPVRYKTVIQDGERLEVEVDDADELAFIVRQDFANWFSFYRRRMLTAKSAIGLTVFDMVNVELGIHGINHDVSEPLRLIDQPDSDDMMRISRTCL